MVFKLVEVLDEMEGLYNMPKSAARFQAYLRKLQGHEGKDIVLPIAGYNPMGGELALKKLNELQALESEAIACTEVQQVNSLVKELQAPVFSVVLNLIDDIDGSWSEYYSTDFTNRFRLGALGDRCFCTPYFFTSEDLTKSLISLRVRSQIYRMKHWQRYGVPRTLADHIAQEKYVAGYVQELWSCTPLLARAKISDSSNLLDSKELSHLHEFVKEHAKSEEFPLLFNFFYGDEASQQLGYRTYNMFRSAGFRFVWWSALSGKE